MYHFLGEGGEVRRGLEATSAIRQRRPNRDPTRIATFASGASVLLPLHSLSLSGTLSISLIPLLLLRPLRRPRRGPVCTHWQIQPVIQPVSDPPVHPLALGPPGVFYPGCSRRCSQPREGRLTLRFLPGQRKGVQVAWLAARRRRARTHLNVYKVNKPPSLTPGEPT